MKTYNEVSINYMNLEYMTKERNKINELINKKNKKEDTIIKNYTIAIIIVTTAIILGTICTCLLIAHLFETLVFSIFLLLLLLVDSEIIKASTTFIKKSHKHVDLEKKWNAIKKRNEESKKLQNNKIVKIDVDKDILSITYQTLEDKKKSITLYMNCVKEDPEIKVPFVDLNTEVCILPHEVEPEPREWDILW